MTQNKKNSKFVNYVRKEEQKLSTEMEKESKGIKWFFKSDTFKIFLAIIIFVAAVSGLLYYNTVQQRIYVENAEISAPIISLSTSSGGIIDNVFVKEGDLIPKDTIVAQVGDESIKSKIAGLVIYAANIPGQFVTPQTSIVKMVDPSQLRVVAKIPEDKGLKDIREGQKVIFTVDAFGSKQYEGVVESVSPTSDESALVFSISDKREEKNFDIKILFDVNKYPELKNGMSAKAWIYK